MTDKIKDNYPYGICHICKGAIAIPGADAFKCGGECKDWVRVLRTPTIPTSEITPTTEVDITELAPLPTSNTKKRTRKKATTN